MQFSIVALTALLSASALAAPASNAKDATSYDISNVETRKYDGETINTITFNISATNGGSLNFQCGPYDPALGYDTDSFESGKLYDCGKNSLFSFRYHTAQDETEPEELFLWQNVSETEVLAGEVDIPNPAVCRAGGSTTNDMICTAPGQVYCITLEKTGQ